MKSTGKKFLWIILNKEIGPSGKKFSSFTWDPSKDPEVREPLEDEQLIAEASKFERCGFLFRGRREADKFEELLSPDDIRKVLIVTMGTLHSERKIFR